MSDTEFVELPRRDATLKIKRPGYRLILVAEHRETRVHIPAQEGEAVLPEGAVIEHTGRGVDFITMAPAEDEITVRTLNHWPNRLKGSTLANVTSGDLAAVFAMLLVPQDRSLFHLWYERTDADDRVLYEILDEVCQGLCEGHPLSFYAPLLGSFTAAPARTPDGSGDSDVNTASPSEMPE